MLYAMLCDILTVRTVVLSQKNNTLGYLLTYELRHSSDLTLLTKWLVFLQNAFGNPVYVNQTNLNGKLRKKLGGAKRGAKQKTGGGMAQPGPP